jgi:ABC-type Na+ efflux pump permease subunit
MSLKRSINQIAAIAKTDFLGVIRNKTAIFFTLLFPLFFIVIIGFTFGQSGTEATSRIVVGIVNLDGELIAVNATDSNNSTIGDLFVQKMEAVNRDTCLPIHRQHGNANPNKSPPRTLY